MINSGLKDFYGSLSKLFLGLTVKCFAVLQVKVNPHWDPQKHASVTDSTHVVTYTQANATRTSLANNSPVSVFLLK